MPGSLPVRSVERNHIILLGLIIFLSSPLRHVFQRALNNQLCDVHELWWLNSVNPLLEAPIIFIIRFWLVICGDRRFRLMKKFTKIYVAQNCNKGYVRTKVSVVWIVLPCSLVELYRSFKVTCCLRHQGDLPDDGSRKRLRKVGKLLPDDTAQLSRRQPYHTLSHYSLKFQTYEHSTTYSRNSMEQNPYWEADSRSSTQVPPPPAFFVKRISITVFKNAC
jgi:hypothetical protein